jgi:hypothetical protein
VKLLRSKCCSSKLPERSALGSWLGRLLNHGSPIPYSNPPRVVGKDPRETRKTSQQATGLTPVILATQEAEIRRITVQSQLGKWFVKPYLEKKHHKKRAGGVAQGIGPEFKPQYHKTNKQTNIEC